MLQDFTFLPSLALVFLDILVKLVLRSSSIYSLYVDFQPLFSNILINRLPRLGGTVADYL